MPEKHSRSLFSLFSPQSSLSLTPSSRAQAPGSRSRFTLPAFPLLPEAASSSGRNASFPRMRIRLHWISEKKEGKYSGKERGKPEKRKRKRERPPVRSKDKRAFSKFRDGRGVPP